MHRTTFFAAPVTARPARTTRRRLGTLAALTLWLGATGAAEAQPSAPWTPSPMARHAIELLVDEAGLDLTTTQWPLPRRAVQRALDALPATLPPALAEARDRARRELGMADASAVTLTARGTPEMLAGFGDDATRGSSVAVRSAAFQGEWLAAQLGARVDLAGAVQGGARLRLDDTAIAIEGFGVQLQAWSHRSWWGPGWQSSLVLGNNAPALTGIGLQRASGGRSESPWLAWLGPWSAEMFVGQTEDVSTPANPYVVGERLTFRPFPNVEIGLTRSAQWGGRGRDQSLHSFFRMLSGTGLNADDPNQQPVDPANEMAGYDLRLRCPTGWRCAGYAQLIGEDQAGLLPSRFLGLYGFEHWSDDGRQRYVVEYAETACRTPIGRSGLKGCAYRNYAYPEGYTSGGRWLGAGVGPDSRIVTLGWLDAGSDTLVRLNYGRIGAGIGRFTPQVSDAPTSGQLFGLSAQRSFAWGAATVTPELAWQRLSAPDGTRNDLRLGATLRMSLDAPFAAARHGLGDAFGAGAGPGASAWQPLLLGTGLVLGAALLDRPADDYVRGHADNPSGRALGHVGSAVPIAAVGLAGLSWALQRGSVQGDVAQAALLAGASAFGVAQVGKFAIDRARPSDGRGASDFGSGARQKSSFPSVHSAVAWAVLTPYAQHHDAPWLYGLAALTNLGRVAGRQHWVSDTVAGAVIGYWLGDHFYRRSGAAEDNGPRLWISPRAVTFQMGF